MNVALRIGLAVVLAVALLVLVTAGQPRGLEIMAVLALIAFLVVRELTSTYTTLSFRGRYDVFIWSGLALFLLIVVRRVRDVLGL